MTQDLISWLEQESPPRVVFENPPLTLVICQVKYTAKIGLGDSRVAGFQDAIEADYPYPSRPEQTLQFGASIGESEIHHNVSLPTSWQFTDVTGNWILTLSEESLSLETKAYNSFDEFQDKLKKAVEALTNTIRPQFVLRIGLRYINEIDTSSKNIDRIIRKEMMGPLAVPTLSGKINQSLQIIAIDAGDAMINLQHGVFRQSPIGRPSTDTCSPLGPVYMLDIDMYQEFTPQLAVKVEADSLQQRIGHFHDTVTAFFRWATTEEYRTSLKRGNDDSAE